MCVISIHLSVGGKPLGHLPRLVRYVRSRRVQNLAQAVLEVEPGNLPVSISLEHFEDAIPNPRPHAAPQHALNEPRHVAHLDDAVSRVELVEFSLERAICAPLQPVHFLLCVGRVVVV